MLIADMALQEIHDGNLVVRGKADREIAAEIANHLGSLVEKGNFEFRIHIDYSQNLLTEGRKFFRRKKPEWSAFFYATYFEHRINWLIVEICRKRKIGDEVTLKLIREVNLKAKCSWVLSLLGHRQMKSAFGKTISGISDIRNAFVHYKWPEKAYDKRQESLDAEWLRKLQAAESAVEYLRRFSDRELYENKGRRVRRVLKAHIKSKLAKPKQDQIGIRRRTAKE